MKTLMSVKKRVELFFAQGLVKLSAGIKSEKKHISKIKKNTD